MQINSSSWHCRVYTWWYRNKYHREPERSNLCPYMRAVMFWAPMRAIFSGFVKIGKVPLGAVTIPGVILMAPVLAGYVSYTLKSALWGGISVCGIIGGTLMGVLLPGYLFSRAGLGWGVKYISPVFEKAKESIEESNFLDLLAAYFHSAHDRVCPEVAWKKSGVE